MLSEKHFLRVQSQEKREDQINNSQDRRPHKRLDFIFLENPDTLFCLGNPCTVPRSSYFGKWSSLNKALVLIWFPVNLCNTVRSTAAGVIQYCGTLFMKLHMKIIRPSCRKYCRSQQEWLINLWKAAHWYLYFRISWSLYLGLSRTLE